MQSAAKHPSPYAYLIEYALANGVLSPNDAIALGFDLSLFVPSPRLITLQGYGGREMAPPARPPYPKSDPVVAALSRGMYEGWLTYDQLDLMGLHPLYLLHERLT